MTTEPKGEGGEAVNPIDSLALELSRFPMAAIVRALDKAVPGFAASYLRPAEVTPSAVEALARAAERANGEHIAPHDCYATGPLTGDPYRDLVSCPGCELAAALAHPEIAALKEKES